MHVVDEAAFYLWNKEPEWCRSNAFDTMTALTRSLVAFAILRLGWDAVPAGDRGPVALVCTSLHDTLGANRFGRLVDRVRRFIRAEQIAAIAPILATRLRDRPRVRRAAFAALEDVRLRPRDRDERSPRRGAPAIFTEAAQVVQCPREGGRLEGLPNQVEIVRTIRPSGVAVSRTNG